MEFTPRKVHIYGWEFAIDLFRCFDTCRALGLGFIRSLEDYAAKTVDGHGHRRGGFARCSSVFQCYNSSSNVATSIFPIFKPQFHLGQVHLRSRPSTITLLSQYCQHRCSVYLSCNCVVSEPSSSPTFKLLRSSPSISSNIELIPQTIDAVLIKIPVHPLEFLLNKPEIVFPHPATNIFSAQIHLIKRLHQSAYVYHFLFEFESCNMTLMGVLPTILQLRARTNVQRPYGWSRLFYIRF